MRTRLHLGGSVPVFLAFGCSSSPASPSADTSTGAATITESTGLTTSADASTSTSSDATASTSAGTSGSGADVGSDGTSSDSASGQGAVLDFCPTRIDVFGYSNVMFSGCGGAGVGVLADGLFAPGTAGYDATLAGRLQARVIADAELTAKLGSQWEVRSCSVGGAVMGTFVDSHPEGECPMAGMPGENLDMCRNSPAPVILYSANNVFDRCHGGGSDARTPDDEATYAAHWAARLTSFIEDRAPELLLVSPQHEWHGQQGGSLADPGACAWSRPSWNRSGATSWRAEHPDETRVELVGDLQDEFMAHHPCCAQLGVACEDDWFVDGDGWVHFGCAGADALEDMWFAALKSTLLAREFACER